MQRVQATPAALAVIAGLRSAHGAICFYLSHGCCDGSSPMCFAPGEMPLSVDDRVLGDIDGVPFHASRTQCEYLQGLALTLYIEPGDAGTFSLEDGSGSHFALRMRLLSDAESMQLPALLPSLPG